jgi:RES domain-containing protein
MEVLAHVEDKAGLAKAKFSAIPVVIDEGLIQSIPPLPKDWRRIPPGASTQTIGDRFVQEATHPVLKVPSVAVPGEFNYLLNPAHPDFSAIKIGKPEPFPFDPRVFSSA